MVLRPRKTQVNLTGLTTRSTRINPLALTQRVKGQRRQHEQQMRIQQMHVDHLRVDRMSRGNWY